MPIRFAVPAVAVFYCAFAPFAAATHRPLKSGMRVEVLGDTRRFPKELTSYLGSMVSDDIDAIAEFGAAVTGLSLVNTFTQVRVHRDGLCDHVVTSPVYARIASWVYPVTHILEQGISEVHVTIHPHSVDLIRFRRTLVIAIAEGIAGRAASVAGLSPVLPSPVISVTGHPSPQASRLESAMAFARMEARRRLYTAKLAVSTGPTRYLARLLALATHFPGLTPESFSEILIGLNRYPKLNAIVLPELRKPETDRVAYLSKVMRVVFRVAGDVLAALDARRGYALPREFEVNFARLRTAPAESEEVKSLSSQLEQFRNMIVDTAVELDVELDATAASALARP